MNYPLSLCCFTPSLLLLPLQNLGITMILNLSSSSLLNSKPPNSDFPSKIRTHLSNSPSSSFSAPNPNPLSIKNPTLFGWSRHPVGRRLDLRSRALGGLDLSNFESVLEAVGVLTAIVVVHEGGHFLAASLQGIHVSKFAVGFGPILAKFKSKNVEYSIRAFPLGGYVGFPDNDPNSDIPVDDADLLKNRPILDRVIVISAGVIANIIFAYVIIFVQVLSVGFPVQDPFPGVLVPNIKPLSAAYRDGLLPGDVILAVNGTELPKLGSDAVLELVDVIKNSPRRNVLFKIERGDKDFEVRVTPDENNDGTGKIGVQLSPNVKVTKTRPKDLVEAFNFSGSEFWGLTNNVVDGLKQTVLNFSQTADKLAGPVAIIAVGAEVAKSNADGLFQFAAILNLNLAVINLLPLPALDGGSLALILIEAARGGRKLPRELEQRIMSSGIMLVLVLGLFLLVRDTLNLDFVKEIL